MTQGAGWLSFSGASTGTNNGQFTVQYGKNETTTTRKGYVKLTAPGADGSGVEVFVKQKGDTTAGGDGAGTAVGHGARDHDVHRRGATATDAVSGDVTERSSRPTR